MKNKAEPTTEIFLPTVLEREACKTHKAPQGVPCFHTPKGNAGGYFAGVCNKRALAAGFNGKISLGALNKVSGVPRFAKKK